MHESPGSSVIESENSRSSVFSSLEGGNNMTGPTCVYSLDDSANAFHCPDRSTSDHDRLKTHQPPFAKDRDVAAAAEPPKNGSMPVGGAIWSDTHMGSKRAGQAANRRMLAALWLQEMVGRIPPLSNEPSEEEFRQCLQNGLILCNALNKVQPGAVPKVIESSTLPNHLDSAQSAHQYFENIRNFLVAVEDMGLPSFEASDLEQGSLSPSSLAKLVDCILALKSYHEWRQGGALGFWRLKSPNQPVGYMTSSGKYVTRSKSMNTASNQARRKWALPDLQGLDDRDMMSSSTDLSVNSLSFDKDSRASFEGISQSAHSGQNGGGDGDADEMLSTMHMSASSSPWLQHIGHKFCEVLQVKDRHMQDMPTSTDAGTAVDNAPSHSLLSLISAILGDKPVEEVPMLVEFMLRKVMEEFERHLLTQRKTVTKMKTTLRELLLREEELVSQNMVLEALAAGSQEEVKMEKKQLEEEKRVKEKEVDRLLKESEEKQMAVQVLKNELDYIKRLDEEHLLRLEKEKREIEVESKDRIHTLELQLQDAHKKMHEIEVNSAREISSLQTKDAKCQKVLTHQAQERKNLRHAQYSAKEEVLQMQVEWKSQLSTLENELQGMARAASGYHKVLAENRALYNEVQDLKGNIRVYCRVRPFLTNELTRPTTVDYIGENGEMVLVNPCKPGGKETRRTFTFNKVFGTTASQEDVFMDTQPLIRSVLDGYNVCIFAYGQTGSGKTFTMSGPSNITPVDWGVNYRALHDLFHMSQNRLDVFHYGIGVQMLEIYNEQVRDLLNTDGVHKKLEIRNKSQLNGLNVPDASTMPVRSTEDVLELMKLGQNNRAVGATALNERSSRSHSVLTVHVQGTDLGSGAILRGCLHLVDLAGSERVDKSEATGDRLKEAQHINKSLSALGDVIAALAQKSGHVPYRNSKLTQLLQDSLGGQAKTLMFVHISPDAESFGETISTLKFAERVSSVELGAACSNKESGEVQNLRDQVAQLRDAAAKKDSEIERLQALKDRAVPTGESNLANKKFKFKPAGASPHPRCMNMEPAAVQRNCKLNIDREGMVAEVGGQSICKIPGLPKQPPSLVLNTSHGSEDATEHFVPSSGYSPPESPTECKIAFEESEVANDMNDKLKLLKMWHTSLGQNHTSTDADIVVPTFKQRHKQQEFSLGNQGEIIMHDRKHLSRILDMASNSQEESFLKEWPERSAKSRDQSVLASEEDEKLLRYSSYVTRHDSSELDIACSVVPSESASCLKLPSNGVFSSKHVTNGCSNRLIQEPLPTTNDGQNNHGVDSKRSSDLLHDVLDGPFENDGMLFDPRDGHQDDSVSLFSESGLSAETDLPSSGPVDQNKKLQSGRLQHERKGLFQTQVPHPPVKNAPKISAIRSDHKSLGGQPQIRPRRYSNVPIPAATDKLIITKRSVSLAGNSVSEVSQDCVSENNSPYDAALKPSLSRNILAGNTKLTSFKVTSLTQETPPMQQLVSSEQRNSFSRVDYGFSQHFVSFDMLALLTAKIGKHAVKEDLMSK